MLPYTERMASKYCVLRAGMDTNGLWNNRIANPVER